MLTTIAATQLGMIGCTTQQATSATAELPIEGELPSFVGAIAWLNSQPLTVDELRGKVVMINFWTYTCINWLRQLPYVRAWAEKYQDRGLVVIGVHTPEFEFEKNIDNVRRASTEMRIGYPALVRREDERAEVLRQLGAEVVQGDLTDLASMHRAIKGVARIYFGMSVSAAYLEATVNTAAVARHQGVEAFVNMSQMTVTQMSITETTPSPQHKLHWLAEQALAWSGLPVVTVRPTVFLEGFFLRLAAAGIRDSDELALPLGNCKTSPISAVDVARAVSAILDDPASHIGHVYNLTGFESADLEHYARAFSEALGRTIRYRNVPLSGWTIRERLE